MSTTALRTPFARRSIVIAAATIAVSTAAVVAPTSATIAASASGIAAGTTVAGSITAAGAAAVVGATGSLPASRVAAPATKVAVPAKKVAAPAKKVAAPAKKVAAPAKKAVVPAARAAAPASRSTARAAVSPYRVGTKAHSQWFARSYMSSTYGWTGTAQYTCLVKLWTRESGWSHTAHNGNGAHGIPQAFPGRKMASAGPNWKTNPETQIKWGLRYIKGRYGSPCGAWSHFTSRGWY